MFFKNGKFFVVRFVLALTLLSGTLGATQVRAEPKVYRVTPGGISDPACGDSWSNPCDLQYALTTVVTAGDEIWVAAGTYKPTNGADRTISFALRNGVAIYGGFAGSESFLMQRSFETNLTVLSGDIGMLNDNSDNSYHVVVGSNTDNSTLLDGFTITAGNAANAPSDSNNGGGMYNNKGSPTLTNIIFSGNAGRWGGGMYNGGHTDSPPYDPAGGSHPILTNITFMGNSAVEGGGMENEGYSNPILTNVTFTGNTATRAGGGMENMSYCNPILTNVIFDSNTVLPGGGFAGGGMINLGSDPILKSVTFINNSAQWGGGMLSIQSSLTITNTTFYGNTATIYGGGMVNESDSHSTLTNVTFSGNTAVTNGSGIYNDSTSSAAIRNSILYKDSGEEIYNASGMANVTYSIVQGGYVGIGNLDADPLLGSLQNNGGFTPTMALGAGSPAIDAGDNANCPATDQRGVTRPQNAACDLGAYEYEDPFAPTATPSDTPTRTPTRTSTPTFMPTFTPTPTKLPTLTSTMTDTPTQTPTRTSLPTFIPTFTPTPTNLPTLTSTMTDTPTTIPSITPTNTATYTPTPTFTPTATPPYSYHPLYLSLANNQTIGGVSAADEDILAFDGHGWTLFFDGSDVGVGSTDLFAFSVLDADTILMSFSSTVTVNRITATPQDILRFDATSLGDVTSGTFSMYFDGSDVGLTTKAESIDALATLPDGRLLISTTGNPSVPGLTTGRDEDVLAFTPTSLGSVTSGTWSMYFDGSDVGLSESSDEDVDALDVIDGNVYLSTVGNFTVPGLSGANEDVFVCAATSLGDVTACNYLPALYFDGSTWGLSANDVDAINFLASPFVVPTTPAITLVP